MLFKGHLCPPPQAPVTARAHGPRSLSPGPVSVTDPLVSMCNFCGRAGLFLKDPTRGARPSPFTTQTPRFVAGRGVIILRREKLRSKSRSGGGSGCSDKAAASHCSVIGSIITAIVS